MDQSNQAKTNPRSQWGDFLKQVYDIWIKERPAQYAAALAYYAVFAVIPVIYVVFSLADLIVSRFSISDWFYGEANALLGEEVASYLQEGVDSLAATTTGGGTLTTMVGVIALLFSASLIFYQLQHTLNTILRIPPPSRDATRAMIRSRLLAFVMLFGVVLIFILASVVNLIISFITSFVNLPFVVGLLSFLSLAGMATLSFAAIYKLLPNSHISWRNIWLGACGAGVAIAVLISVLGIYLRASRLSSALEAASAMAVLLIFFYVLGQIFALGAILVRVHAAVFSGVVIGQDVNIPKNHSSG
jgi:membrane protein